MAIMMLLFLFARYSTSQSPWELEATTQLYFDQWDTQGSLLGVYWKDFNFFNKKIGDAGTSLLHWMWVPSDYNMYEEENSKYDRREGTKEPGSLITSLSN